jgi:hypothetical protein
LAAGLVRAPCACACACPVTMRAGKMFVIMKLCRKTRLDDGQFRFGVRRPLRRASAASTPKR